ncbi:MAG: type II toxin-antitoxin system MqsR family toxin [Bdellovibrionota bacterium]
MEKRVPSFKLSEIQSVFSNVQNLRITRTAWRSASSLGIRRVEILEIVAALKDRNFYKSMPSYADQKIWQDVYRSKWGATKLYIKFTISNGDFLILSFKEL